MSEEHPTTGESASAGTRSPKALHLRGIHKHYGGRTVVQIDDIELGAHGIEGLIGPNGAGKTTLMKLITNVVAPNAGQIEYHGLGKALNLSQKSPDAIARMGIVKTTKSSKTSTA